MLGSGGDGGREGMDFCVAGCFLCVFAKFFGHG